MYAPREIIDTAIRQGVTVAKKDDEHLTIRGKPKPALLALLKEHKQAILDYLGGEPCTQCGRPREAYGPDGTPWCEQCYRRQVAPAIDAIEKLTPLNPQLEKRQRERKCIDCGKETEIMMGLEKWWCSDCWVD